MPTPIEDAAMWRRWVLDNEGLTDWEIVHGEPYCWIKDKRIMVYPSTGHTEFLHEVAHALHPHPEPVAEGRDPNYYHGYHWSVKFTRLVNKYMKLKSYGEVEGAKEG